MRLRLEHPGLSALDVLQTHTETKTKTERSKTMTVKQLIAELRKFAPDAKVVLSTDEEGNGFSPLREVCCGNYEADANPRAPGEFVAEDGTAPVNAVCLWPSH
jgi:predicted DNA-binding ribbon-helix-helix protein